MVDTLAQAASLLLSRGRASGTFRGQSPTSFKKGNLSPNWLDSGPTSLPHRCSRKGSPQARLPVSRVAVLERGRELTHHAEGLCGKNVDRRVDERSADEAREVDSQPEASHHRPVRALGSKSWPRPPTPASPTASPSPTPAQSSSTSGSATGPARFADTYTPETTPADTPAATSPPPAATSTTCSNTATAAHLPLQPHHTLPTPPHRQTPRPLWWTQPQPGTYTTQSPLGHHYTRTPEPLPGANDPPPF